MEDILESNLPGNSSRQRFRTEGGYAFRDIADEPNVFYRDASRQLSKVEDPIIYFMHYGSFLVGAGEMIELGQLGLALGRAGLKRLAMAEVRAAGIAGERAVGITESKIAINVAGRRRFPDRLTEYTLEEVKNVGHQNFTRQLRDFYQHAQDKELQMILHTRSTTTFSKPLQALLDNGSIIRENIPGL